MFSRSSRSRTLHRWISSIVQSCMPVVPSAQPSQTPWFRIRQAYAGVPRFSLNAFQISR